MKELSEAWGRIQEEQQREQYERALGVLRTIPSGTPDNELTDEQRRAWKEHDEALAWLAKAWHEYLDDSALDEQ